MSATDLARRQRELTVQSAIEKLMTLVGRLELHQDHEGRELVRHIVWDLMDLRAGK